MKSVELRNANAALRDYAAELSKGPLVLTRGGRAVAALVRIGPSDLESFLVSQHPTFRRIVRRSRTSYRRSGGLTRAEMEKRLKKAPRPRTSRPV